MGRKQKGGARMARVALRREEIIKLRSQGLNYKDIAPIVGCSESQAWKDCQAALATYRERLGDVVEEKRMLDASLLDQIVATFTPAALAGDLPVTIVLLKVLERRAKLLGLDLTGALQREDEQGMTIIDQLRAASARADEIVIEEKHKKLCSENKVIDAKFDESDKS